MNDSSVLKSSSLPFFQSGNVVVVVLHYDVLKVTVRNMSNLLMSVTQVKKPNEGQQVVVDLKSITDIDGVEHVMGKNRSSTEQ